MKALLMVLLVTSSISYADPGYYGSPYGMPYNQTYTYNNNQSFSTDWYNSPLGMGAAQIGVTLVSGLVNAMNKPDPVIIRQPRGQYPAQQAGYNTSYPTNQRCSMQTVYDSTGNPRIVQICE